MIYLVLTPRGFFKFGDLVSCDMCPTLIVIFYYLYFLCKDVFFIYLGYINSISYEMVSELCSFLFQCATYTKKGEDKGQSNINIGRANFRERNDAEKLMKKLLIPSIHTMNQWKIKIIRIQVLLFLYH